MLRKKSMFILRYVLPWIITIAAIYFVTKEIDFELFYEYFKNSNKKIILFCICITFISYLLRSVRWQILFPVASPSYLNAVRVLFMGFFMNNILPAKAGEFIRAHLGSKVSQHSTAVVLGTVFSERLADGLTLSFLFVLFSLNVGDQKYSFQLYWVSIAFISLCIIAILILLSRKKIILIAKDKIEKGKIKSIKFLLRKINLLSLGVEPLFSYPKSISITSWSLLIWSTELLVFYLISVAFHHELSFSSSILFMVIVNFSSLIPAAPGGIGVIEAAASAVLISIGVEKEIALAMVVTQHIIQYLVVGIPGIISFLTWKGKINNR